jgi:hypothetical protein
VAITDTIFRQRARAAGLSVWELGELLGIHPHQLGGNGQRLEHLPCTVIIDLARRLDMHPADLVDGLDSVLANPRAASPAPPATLVECPTSVAPVTDHDPPDATSPEHDVGIVLVALAHASEPLTVDELATALDWTLQRITAALDHAQRHPNLASPVALRRTGPGTYTVTARLDRLTRAQRDHLGQAQLARHPLRREHAEMLLAVLALRSDPDDYLAHRADHLDAERDLKRHGLIHTEHGPHHPETHADVRYSLRYWNTPEDPQER